MIDRAVKDPVFMQYMAGDKQVIMTGEIEGFLSKSKLTVRTADESLTSKQ